MILPHRGTARSCAAPILAVRYTGLTTHKVDWIGPTCHRAD
jgi:hypothetical protein